VLDVETTGLDTGTAQLLAIAAVAVYQEGDRLCLRLADSFEAQLRHDADTADDAARANVLLHGIGLGAQRAAAEPASVLREFARYLEGAPLLGFHVAFDRRVLQRAWARFAPEVPPPQGPWIDIEALAAVCEPRLGRVALDDWLHHYGIVCAQRHQAAADTVATAELLLRLWPGVRAQLAASQRGQGAVAALLRLQRDRRWLGN
jgi:DNA polymerase III subunit epsilon